MPDYSHWITAKLNNELIECVHLIQKMQKDILALQRDTQTDTQDDTQEGK